MKYALGMIAIDGINLAVAAVTMLRVLPTYQDQKQNNLNAGICLIVYGCGQSIAGYFGGRLCDKYRIRQTVTLILILYCMACACTFANWYIRQFWSAIIGCFLWGLAQASLMTGLMVICSRLY